jgi:hypothetical protein
MTSEQIERLLEKASRSIAASEDLLDGGYPDFAASRAYYATFYVAEALLLSRGLSFSSHAGVIAAFGKHFAKRFLASARSFLSGPSRGGGRKRSEGPSVQGGPVTRIRGRRCLVSSRVAF